MSERSIPRNQDQAATPQDLTGQKLGRFLIRHRLGAGGMGVVYCAHDERLDRDVALKVLPPGLLTDEKARLRFRREALALSRLNHPNIETVHDFDTQGGIDFLVMELIPGESLDQKLTAGAMRERELCRLGEQMAEALAAAHERGVVHRDLKPGNLRLTADGRLKVLDFGIAKLFQSSHEYSSDADTLTASNLPDLTRAAEPGVTSSFQTEGVGGTLPYMPPEQLRGDIVDARSDIYSAGVVLYEMCCGQLPFPYSDSRKLIDAILNDSPILPSKLARVSPAFEAVVLKALQKNPAKRHQSARELLSDLRRLGKQERASKAIDSIAVLPFENQNLDTEYLSDGITEALIQALSELPSLRKVIARSSVFRYKGRQIAPEEVGRELNVRAVLTGRIVQHGEGTSITAELVDSADARRLWGGQYQRDMAVVPQIQREIADDICEKLRLRLAPARRKSAATHAPNPEAFRLYLKGRYYWNKRPGQGMVQKAIEHFEQATEQDPKFAPAYVGLADCYNALGRWEFGAMAPRVAFPLASQAASRALRLDSTLAEAHSALAYITMHYDWDWARAADGFERALKLNPNSSHAHHWYAHYLMAMGRIEEALGESLRILELDPLDVIINVHLAWHYYYAHQFPVAADVAKKTLEMEPHSDFAHFYLGQAYEQMKMYSEAVDALEKSLALSGGNIAMKSALGHAYGLAGYQAAALEVIEELKKLSITRYVSSYEIGLIYAAIGNNDEAFSSLNRACEERSGWFPYLKAEPRLDRLHSDPRFGQLVQRVGLAPV